jgi:hypothetical protein
MAVLLAGLALALCVLAVSLGSLFIPAGAPAFGEHHARVGRFPTASSAREAPLPPPGAFRLKASNGYSIFVFGARAYKDKPAAVTLLVTSKRDAAIYSVPAVVTETSIQADLGDLGEIVVTFHPSGKPQTNRSRCGGKPVTFDSGVYEGTITFHGEEGYTAVEATRAQGSLDLLIDLLCPGAFGSIGGPHLPGAQLDAYAGGSWESPHLRVVKNRPHAPAHFEADVSEKHGRVSVARYVGAIAPARTFEYDPKVQVATVRPPSPFSGTARFRKARSANRWTGDLSVDFPGRADVRLTGRRAHAKLLHAHWVWNARLGSGQ